MSEGAQQAFKILRTCWVTPSWVWRLARQFMSPCDLDPFWNPWSTACEDVRNDPEGMLPQTVGVGCESRPFVGLDGSSPTSDGFKVENWSGKNANANGPWSAPVKWVPTCAEFGRTRNCFAVVPNDTTKWFYEHAWAADLLIFPEKRVQFVSPWPDVVKVSSARCGAVFPMWLPSGPLNLPRDDKKTEWFEVSRRAWPRKPTRFEFEGRKFLLVRGRGER